MAGKTAAVAAPIVGGFFLTKALYNMGAQPVRMSPYGYGGYGGYPIAPAGVGMMGFPRYGF